MTPRPAQLRIGGGRHQGFQLVAGDSKAQTHNTACTVCTAWAMAIIRDNQWHGLLLLDRDFGNTPVALCI